MGCIVLGRNGPYPSAGGACSGYLLKAKGRALLFDLGAGTFSRLVSFMDPAKVSGTIAAICWYLSTICKQQIRRIL